jgi:UDP-N-acetyl-D-galactosamine dehydrogenase
VIAVAHKQFKKLGIKKIKSFGKSKHIVYDLKYLFSQAQVDKRL